MKKKLLVLVFVLSLFFVLPVEVESSKLPCYNKWKGCLDGGGNSNYCEGVWLGCMESTYGA